MISDMSSSIKWLKMEGLKKASLYDHFEGLTPDSYLAKQDTLGGEVG